MWNALLNHSTFYGILKVWASAMVCMIQLKFESLTVVLRQGFCRSPSDVFLLQTKPFLCFSSSSGWHSMCPASVPCAAIFLPLNLLHSSSYAAQSVSWMKKQSLWLTFSKARWSGGKIILYQGLTTTMPDSLELLDFPTGQADFVGCLPNVQAWSNIVMPPLAVHLG